MIDYIFILLLLLSVFISGVIILAIVEIIKTLIGMLKIKQEEERLR